jgi:putative membrane protein
VQRELWRYITVIAASIGTVVIGSCKERQGADRPSGTAESPAPGDPGAAAAIRNDTALAPSSVAGDLTDANIVALLDEANQADSAAGAYALGKATNPDVKAFAKLMMGEHHALRAQGQQLAQRLKVTPQPPANDPVQAAATSEMAALRAAPKGPQFDRTYIDQEVAIHKAVLDLAEKAHESAQNQELKALIEQAKPVIEKHRDRAEEIQKKLGKPSA